MILPSDIGWGAYQDREGPFFPGRARIPEPRTPDPLTKLLLVLLATESGGRPDAINFYDRCDLTLGLIQHCEAAGQQCAQLLWAIRTATGPDPFEPLEARLASRGMRLGMAGPTMAFLDRKGAAILTATERQNAFFAGSKGTRGGWSQAQRTEALEWAATFATVLGDPRTFEPHLRHASGKLLSYVMAETRRLVFPGGVVEGLGWRGALQAVVTSFSANLPAVADRHFRAFVAEQGGRVVDSESFVVGATAALTYRPRIGIYPERLRAILPTVQRLYGVNLSAALVTPPKGPPPSPIEAELDKPHGLQAALLALGYDLGPKGADGVIGAKTREAVKAFQKARGLEVDGVVGPRTRAELAHAVETALAALPKGPA
jgi:hypothetical protein